MTANDAGDGDAGANQLATSPSSPRPSTRAAPARLRPTARSTPPTPHTRHGRALRIGGGGPQRLRRGDHLPHQRGPRRQRQLRDESCRRSPPGSVITATFTDAAGNTSELSAALAVVATPFAPTNLDVEPRRRPKRRAQLERQRHRRDAVPHRAAGGGRQLRLPRQRARGRHRLHRFGTAHRRRDLLLPRARRERRLRFRLDQRRVGPRARCLDALLPHAHHQRLGSAQPARGGGRSRRLRHRLARGRQRRGDVALRASGRDRRHRRRAGHVARQQRADGRADPGLERRQPLGDGVVRAAGRPLGRVLRHLRPRRHGAHRSRRGLRGGGAAGD